MMEHPYPVGTKLTVGSYVAHPDWLEDQEQAPDWFPPVGAIVTVESANIDDETYEVSPYWLNLRWCEVYLLDETEKEVLDEADWE